MKQHSVLAKFINNSYLENSFYICTEKSLQTIHSANITKNANGSITLKNSTHKLFDNLNLQLFKPDSPIVIEWKPKVYSREYCEDEAGDPAAAVIKAIKEYYPTFKEKAGK